MDRDSPERLAVSEGAQRKLVGIRGVERHRVAPPHGDSVRADGAIPREVQAEEDHNHRDSHAGVETSGQHV